MSPSTLAHPAEVDAPRAAAADLREQVADIAAEVAPAWPLERFVAVNPLAGLEHLPFAEAVRHAEATLGAPGWRAETALRAAEREGRIAGSDLRAAVRRRLGARAGSTVVLGSEQVSTLEAVALADLRHAPPASHASRRIHTPAEASDAHTGGDLADRADALMTSLLSAFLDAGQARWQLPRREQGLYPAWRALCRHDPAFSRSARRRLDTLPGDGEQALAALLDETGLDDAGRGTLLRALLTRQPGWTAHARWRAEHAGDLDLVDLAAVRLACERALLHPVAGEDALRRLPAVAAPAGDDARARLAAVAAALDADPEAPELAAALDSLPATARPAIWQEALEAGFRRRLLGAIDGGRPTPAAGPPAAQVVCCIDVRSEPLRRALETVGPYETLGFAGFFGLAIEARALGGGVTTEQCPVLISPAATVAEVADAGAEDAARHAVRRADRLAAARDAFAGAKKGLVAKYAFAEAVGFAMGPIAAARTLAPDRAATIGERAARRSPVPTTMDLSALTVEDRATAAKGALVAMGLVDGFAPVVVLCGHGSTTANNPHQAALDCGACGGHRGGPNARAMAAVLNDPEIRALIAADGIEIPAGTWFAAAEHDTATDVVTLLDDVVPAEHRVTVDRLREDLARAGADTAAERARRLPGADPDRPGAAEARVRSRDWAQIAPEWGLAGCAALVVGSRELTVGRDLGGRVFLHSYDAAADPDAEALTVILTAPLVVAHWIASQYYFSSVAPEQFGAGTKISHNVVGAIGVLSGPGGDLRGGLPWESVAVGDRLEHEPMRLLAVVDAPLERIDAILDGAPQVAALVDGEWVTIVARDGEDAPWHRRVPGGGWTAADETEVTA